MSWNKNDTPLHSHAKLNNNSGEDTYIVYLNEYTSNLVINNNKYEIKRILGIFLTKI